MSKWLISIITGYLIGSVPVSYILVRLVGGFDLRSKGSGNLGTTNVMRALGLKYAVLNYALDMLKGALSYWIAQSLFGGSFGLLGGAAATFGHCFSPFVHFKGGKGVAVASGMLFAHDWRILAILLVVQFAVLFLTRRMSAGSLSSAASAPVVAWLFEGVSDIFYTALFVGLFVIFQHRANIGRLLRGEEKALF